MDDILSIINLVHRRRYRQAILNGAVWGLLFGSGTALVLLLNRMFIERSELPSWEFLGLWILAPVVIGGILGGLLPQNLRDSARQVDRSCRLKDRVVTALQILARSRTTPMERLQLADATQSVATVDPKSVVPYRIPKKFFWSVGLVVLVLALNLVSPIFNPDQKISAAQRVPKIADVAEMLQGELVEKIEELAEKNPEERKLKELSEKLQELVAQLNRSATDSREALATLSEMEQAIRSTMGEFQLAAVDTSLQELAQAMSAAEATRPVSQALKNENYSKAADELEKLGAESSESLSKQERAVVSDQMREAGKNMDRRGQKSLSQATEQTAEMIEKGEKSKDGQDGVEALAEELRKQSIRKEISEGLEGKLSLLSLSKAECNGGSGQGAQDGGDNTNKSDQSGDKWGTGAAGNPTAGEETKLDGNRERQELKGMLGQGDSEYEKIRSDEVMQEKSVQELREAFQEYRKMSESVLEAEPIPLGQRQMIRRYFESIRP